MSLAEKTAAVSVLAVAVMVGGLAAPTAAVSATLSVRLQICNERVNTRTFEVSG